MGLLESSSKIPERRTPFRNAVYVSSGQADFFRKKIENGAALAPAEVFVKRLWDTKQGVGFSERKVHENICGRNELFEHSIRQACMIGTSYLEHNERKRIFGKELLEIVGAIMKNDIARKYFEEALVLCSIKKSEPGRLTKLDNIVRAHFGEREILFLDIGAGIFENGGAKSSEETAQRLRNAQIIVTDVYYPPFFSPSANRRVKYLQHDIVNGEIDENRFDAVRIVNVLYQFSFEVAEGVYAKVRSAVREGGILISGNDMALGELEPKNPHYLVERKDNGQFSVHENSLSKNPGAYYIDAA